MGADAELTMDMPLNKRVCRLFAGRIRPVTYTNNGPRPVKPFHGLSVEQYADLVADMGTEVWSVDTGWTAHGVFFESEMVPVNKDVDPGQFKALIRRAQQRGILMQGLQQLSEVTNRDLSGKMDAWAIQPIDDGTGRKADPRWLSYANADFRQWWSEHMIEHIRVLDIDGFWFDGTPFAQRTGWPWAPGCLSDEARADFKAKTGLDAPEKVDWSSQVFREWVKWRYDTTVDFMSAVTMAAEKEKPNLAVAMVYNMSVCDWHLGLPMRRLDDRRWYPAIHGPETRLLDKLGRAMSPRTELWFWASWFDKDVVWGEGQYFDPDKTIAAGLRTLAHGVYPSLGGWSADFELLKDGIKDVFDEFKKRRDFIGGQTVKYAAILVSQQTRDYRRQPGEFWQSVEGVSDLHSDQHLLSDVIFDEDLTAEGLKPYPVVVLPNVGCLSEAQCNALRQYVRDGGTLISTASTSLYDEWGNRREDFALAGLFGVHHVADKSFATGSEGDSTQILIPKTERFSQAFERFVCFMAPAVRVRTVADSGAEILFAVSKRSSLNALNLRSDTYDSSEPGIVRNRYGRGVSIYLTAAIGKGYHRKRHPRAARLLAALEQSSATPPLEFQAPAVLETTAFRRGPKELVAHLVNATALSLGKMAPLADISITVNDGSLKRATSPITGTRFKIKDNRVTVPVVRYGEVVVLELE